jgi:hypothetical protein
MTVEKRKLLRFVEGRLYFDNELRYEWLDMDRVNKEADQMSNQWLSCAEGCKIEVDGEEHSSLSSPSDKLSDYFGFRKLISALKGKNPIDDETLQAEEVKITTRMHKIAYFLLVHKDFDNIVSLINALVDPYVTILIHVDGKDPELKERILEFLAEESKINRSYARVRVMKRSFCGLWGHSSLVYVQLAGFFELLTISSEWEYVINLSGHDYPLKRNDALYEDLKSFGEANFIDHWSSHDGTRVG